MKALRIKPMCRPEVIEIDGSLESLQKEVGGMIQATYPWDDKVALICNDEGKLMGLEFNRPLYNADAQMYDYVVGTFLIVGLTEDDFGSLSDEMVEKYTRMFRRCYGLQVSENTHIKQRSIRMKEKRRWKVFTYNGKEDICIHNIWRGRR